MISVILTSLAAVGAGLWWLFRRPSRPLTPTDLPASLPEGMELVPQLSEEERNAVKTAFLKGPDFRWITAGPSHTTDLDPKQHWDLTSYLLDAMFSFSELYGNTFVCRDKDGTFLGVITMVAPYKSHAHFYLHFILSVIPLGIPTAYSMGKDVKARFDAFGDTMKHHKNVMKGIPHYYVPIVGVSEAAQGKGVGRRLLQTARAIAGDTPVYLDCHDGNVAFYEKQGMTQTAHYDIVPNGFEDQTFPYNGMTYGV